MALRKFQSKNLPRKVVTSDSGGCAGLTWRNQATQSEGKGAQSSLESSDEYVLYDQLGIYYEWGQ